MIVVNLFAGPGRGKSVMAAEVFALLKKAGVNCELVQEYAKSRVWEESFKTLDDQVYVFGKQAHRQFQCSDKVDVVVTDSPLLLSVIYDKSHNKYLRDLVFNVFDQYVNLNYVLDYSFEHQMVGRMHDKTASDEIHQEIKDMLDDESYEYTTLDRPTPRIIAIDVMLSLSTNDTFETAPIQIDASIYDEKGIS